ncbi:hypothetical protein GCM10007989_36570 [Devosia pacifica]|uniref:DUF1206 domain-containing protein n=1 Tax=Devosia pacifica TaxID=1335967 RepID=A0A918SF11_9HYPH|nr:DUF1206 domain-containing protein [Devosia pacifica]GHA37098.1 hypothetical protein GCM10007989_36570 [Devosia pacifica]
MRNVVSKGILGKARVDDSDGPTEVLARAGYGARGVVYFLIGGLSFLSVFWGESDAADSGEALSTLLRQPFGQILLGLVAVGMIGHVVWRLAQSVLNADDQKNNMKGVLTRIGQFASAIANGSIAASAASLALGRGGGGGGDSEQSISSWLMHQPFGPWLVGIAGAIVAVVGLVQIYRGVAGTFQRWIYLPSTKGLLYAICVFGLSARGALFIVVGGFFIYAGFTVTPDNAGGLRDALVWVRALPFGTWLYGIAALGLVAFGGYSIIEAIYRKVDAPDRDDLERMAKRAT